MKVRLSILLSLIANLVFSQSYHDTQGKLEISNSGQATYTLPIALPPSISSVGPTINLVYASGQNSGIAGQGWSINGISYISRMATRKDIDGFNDGVDFDDNDKLALDGQRLLIKTGTYWADSSTYETEVQSNTKIELKGTGSNIYFIVTSPDGSRSWYGNYDGTNGTDLSAYYIVRYEDTNGNFMRYNYSKPLNKSLCIQSISFSANTNSNTTPLNFVNFNYTTAARSEKGYFKGALMEKAELLNNIKVFTNGALFKEYVIEHQTDSQLGYQKVVKITEKNGAGESANPIVFDYNPSDNVVNEITTTYTDSYSINDGAQLTGDFDGDGKMDIIVNNSLRTNLFTGTSSNFALPYLGTLRQKFTATTLSNNKLNQKQSIVYANENINSIDFKIYNLENNGIVNSYVKTFTLDNSGICEDSCTVLNYDLNGNVITGLGQPISKCTSPIFIKDSNKYIEGDFNGDSISEVLVLSYLEGKTYAINNTGNNPGLVTNTNIGNGDCGWQYYTSDFISEARIIDLNPSSPIGDNTIGNIKLSSTDLQLLQNGQRFVMDFNGDGKADLIVIKSDKSYKIINFKQLITAPWIELEIIGQGTIDNYAVEKTMLFGDYNGDGKPDIMIPNGDGENIGDTTWHIYYGNPSPTGGVFFDKKSYAIVDYVKKYGDDYSSYYALDINKDGKTDLVRAQVGVYERGGFWDANNHNSRWSISSYVNNIGNNQAGSPAFFCNYVSRNGHDDEDNGYPIPLATNVKYRGLSSDMLVIRDHGGGSSFDRTITYIDFRRNIGNETLLNKVTQSNGAIVDEITYTPMQSSAVNNGFGLPSDFYSSNNSLDYPFVEIKQIPNNKLVSQLKNTSAGTTKYQDFKYSGYAVQINCVGSMGFLKTARCAWYNTSADKKTWSVSEINPLLRGATKYTYTLQPSTTNFSFPTNLSTGLMSKTENNFSTPTPGVFPYTILLQNQKSIDYITGIVKETVYNTYDAYNLPTKVTANNYLGTTLQSSTTTETVYDPPSFGTGSNYFIGRPNKITTTSSAYGDVKKSMKTIDYTNGNVWHNYNNVYTNGSTIALDPVTIVETMSYYPNGLLKDKQVSATGTTAGINDVSPRKISYTYDPTNRFVSTVTDAEGLVSTNVSFHPLYGCVLVAKNPFNQTTTSVYDNWGKRTSVTDNNLNLKTNYAYTRANTIYTTTVTNTTAAGVSDGSSSIVEQDILSREIRKGSKNINGTMTYVSTEYDAFGRKYRVSEPYFTGASPTQWTVYAYDDYSRPVTITSFTGKVVTNVYNELTVTTNDSVMVKSKTMDANGQVASTTDTPGGTVNYKYDANYNLLESNYDGIKTILTYDNWGRKNYYKESSEGTFTYTYNAYGELKKEDAPKGITTYTYDSLSGRVLSKAVVGKTTADGTNSTNTYVFNPTTKLLETMSVVNANDGNSTFVYTYDPQRRLYKTVETQNLLPSGTAVFTKQLTFDSFSRVDTETNTATAFGKTSSNAIKHSYSSNNGAENQIKDNTTAANLWLATTADARGNVLTATLGNGINSTNTFDQYGYASQFQHKLGTTDVMTLKTTFEPVLGNLSYRYNSMFDTNENFVYDTQDRLTSWNGFGQNIVTLPFNTSTDGFTFNGTSAQGSVTNATGTLKVILKNTIVSANKPLTVNATTGDIIRVKATITNKTGSSGVAVNAVMVETDPLDATNYTQVYIGAIENGTFDSNYTVSDFVQNPKLTLRFIIDDSSPPPIQGTAGSNNGSVTIIPSPSINTTFYVDNLKIDAITNTTQDYDNRGRITANNLGNYNYTNTVKPYQNTSIGSLGGTKNFYQTTQSITYNTFKAPIQIISTGNTAVSFGYNANEQRSVMYYGSLATDKLARPNRRYYSADGSMEISATFAAGNTTTPTTVEFLTYIGGTAYSAPVVLKSNGTAYNYFYLHRDYQGSILAITNATGGVVEKRLFDPWGFLTKVQDGAGVALAKMTFFDRGYTGHEHLQDVGLINMNARLYSPTLHRFLEADNFLQDPSNTQNYNKYGYCVNNPLKYTDVTGNTFNIATLLSYIPVVGTIWYGLLMHQPIDWGRVAVDAVVFAVTAAVTFGVSSAFMSICNFTSTAVGFWSGAAIGGATGFVTGVASSAFSTVISGGSLKLGQLLTAGAIGAAIGAVAGGIKAGNKAVKEGDSNFWTGEKELDTSRGVGAHTAEAQAIVEKGSIMGKYVGKFQEIKVYESKLGFLGSGEGSGGLTLPPNAMIVGKGAYSLLRQNNRFIIDLFHHEFGHILEYRQPFVGLVGFYKVIAPESLLTSNLGKSIADNYWTETWANHLSTNYFGTIFTQPEKYPSAPLSFFNFCKFLF